MADNTVKVTFEFDAQNADAAVQKLSESVGSLTDNSQRGSNMLQQMSVASGRLDATTGKMTGNMQGVAEALRHSSDGAKGFELALKRITSIPILAVVSALIAAIQSLFAWFTRTTEGQQAFARISGYLSGVLDALGKVAVQVGEWIYKAFNDPQKAVNQLWTAIKQNLVNRLEGLGEMFRALGRLIASGFQNEAAFNDLKEAAVKTATGVENLNGKMKQYIAGVHESAKATAELSVAETALQQQRSAWQVEDARLEAEANRLRAQGASTKAIMAIEQQRHNQKVAFAQEELRIARERQKLRGDDSETDNINRLEADLIRLQSKRDTIGSVALKHTQKTHRSLLAEQQAYHDAWKRGELEFEQKQIDLLDESFYKQQKQAALNRRKELAAIEQQQTETLQKKREAFGAGATLTEDEVDYFDQLKKLAEEGYAKTTAEITQQINEAFAEGRLRFADELAVQLADIDHYYAQRLKQAAGNEALIAQLVENRQKERTLATNAYRAEMLEYDIEITRKQMENGKAFWKWEADKRAASIRAERDHLQKRLRLMEEQQRIAPTDRLAKEIELARLELEKYNQELANIPVQKLGEMTDAFARIAGALGGLEGEIGEVFRSLSGSMSSITQTLQTDMTTTAGKASAISTAVSGTVALINMITSAASRRKKAEQEFYQNSIAFAHEYALSLNEQLMLQGKSGAFVRNYSKEIQGSFKALNDATTKYQEALDKLGAGKARVAQKNATDWNNVGKGAAVGVAAGAATGALIGAAAGSVVPLVGTAIGAVVGVVGGVIAGLVAKKKKDVKQDLLDKYPDLITASGDLNKELAQTLVATNKVDDKTKQLLQNALEWQQAIDRANESLKEIVTDLAGDLAGNLRNAIVGAWKAGEDASRRMFEVAGDSLESFITQLLYSAMFSDVFEEFKQGLMASLKPDGDQDVVDDYLKLVAEMDKRDERFIEHLDRIKKKAKELGFHTFGEAKEAAGSSGRTGAARGIQSITQETATAIEGRLTALLIYQDGIRTSVGGINQTLLTGISVLAEIRDNTAYCRRLEKIEGDIGSVRREVESINTRGIIIRTA